MDLSIEINQSYISDTETIPQYGKTVCLIGRSEKGQQKQPYLVKTYERAKELFGEGELVEAFQECKNAGGHSIFLIRSGDNDQILSEEDMQIAYNSIADMSIHIVCPVGIYLDDVHNYALQLARSCKRANDQYGDRVGVIGVKPIQTPIEENLFQHVNSLITNSTARNGFFDYDGSDIGYLISVVASELEFVHNSSTSYSVNGAAAYTGHLARLRPGESPLNKVILGARNLRYSFPTYNVERIDLVEGGEQVLEIILEKKPERPIYVRDLDYNTLKEGEDYEIDFDRWALRWLRPIGPSDTVIIVYSINDYKALSSAGYTTFSDHIDRGVVVESSSTLAKRNSLTDVNVVRTLQSIVYTIKHVCQDLIGETVSQVLMVEDFIRNYLDELVSFRYIYSYQVEFSVENFHTVNINLSITTSAGVKTISVGIKVSS